MSTTATRATERPTAAPARSASTDVVRQSSDRTPPTGAPMVRLAPLRLPPVTSAPATVRTALARGGGEPLVLPVRAPLERSLGVDLAPVRVHADPASGALVDGMGARAFAIGANIFLGSRERATDLPLLAHEVTHVVQQQGAAHVQRLGGAEASDPLEREADRVAGSVVSGRRDAVRGRTEPRPQFGVVDWTRRKARAAAEFVGDVVDAIGDLIGKALDFVKERAKDIPGYPMLTFVLGRDPITQEPVERNAVNLIRALMGLWPFGNQILEALEKYGIISKVGGWLDDQLKTLGLAASAMRQALDRFLKTLGPESLLDLGGVWDRAKKIFSEPIDRVKTFVRDLATGVLEFVRDAVLIPLARLAQKTRGYDLIRAILGRDPISGEPVPLEPATVIRGFLKLIDREEIYDNMQKAKAMPRAAAWFRRTLGELKAFVTQVPQRFLSTFKSLGIGDYIALPKAIAKVGRVFLDVVGEFASWAGSAMWTLLEIIFEVVSPKTLEYVRRTGAAMKSILRNPMPFMGNLVKAAKLGFQNFADNFVEHLKAGLINWLVGALPGVYIPKAFTLPEVVKFVFSVLGISWATIRAKLVKLVGETAVKAMETGFDIVVTLVRDGPAAAWEKIKEQLAALKDTVIGGIIDMVVEAVVVKAIPKLISLFIPGAGFISAIIAIYDVIKTIIEKLATIVAVATAFIDSIVAIAAGAITAAAKKVESMLAGVLSLAINFLANFAGLGKVAAKIMEIIGKVRATVDKALEAVVNWIVTMAKKLFGAVKAGVKKLMEWWKISIKLTRGGEPHTLKYDGTGRGARLAVHSKPKKVPEFVRDFEGMKGRAADARKARELDAKIISLQTQIVSAEQDKNQGRIDELTAELKTMIDNLAATLDKLLQGGEGQGSESDPLPIDYPKRSAATYPTIYVGPRVGEGNRIPQDTLRTLSRSRSVEEKKEAIVAANPKLAKNEALKEWDGAVRTLLPEQQTTLDGNDIGLSPEFASLRSGKILVSAFKAGTGGGGKVNKILKPYGYVPKSDGGEGLDGDHVLERQLGGPDEPRNLWPLPASENRSSGSQVKNLKVKYPDQEGLTLEQVREKRKAEVYLLVRSVKAG